MSDIVSSIDYVLRQEDSRMTGEVTDAAGDSGGRTRYGIAEKFHPELTARGYFDSMPAAQALGVAQSVYTTQYALPLQLDQIVVQQVANAMLSFAVNEGVGTAVKLLQKAIGVTEDGHLGPTTLRELNAHGYVLTKLLYVVQCDYYEDVVARNPVDARFLAGWLNRVKQDCEVA